MMAGELLAMKLQELLGENYKIFTDDAFCDDFTTATTGFLGTQLAVDKTAFNKYKNIIVGVVKLIRPFRANVDFYSVTADYEVIFWVPINIVKRDINDVLIETPKLDFYADMEKLLKAVVNKKIIFEEEKYGRLSMTEPYGLGTREDTATGTRKAMQVSGKIHITDNGIFGGGIRCFLEIDGKNILLEGINSISVQMATDGSVLVESGNVKPKTDLSQQAYSVTLSFDDFSTSNLAINELKAIVRKNNIPNEHVSDKRKKGKVYVIILYEDGESNRFWALPEITFKTAKNEIGNYFITFTNDNRPIL